MERVKKVSVDQANPEVKTFYDTIQRSMGKVPNIFLHMGNSPSLLKAYFGLTEAVNATTLNPKLREEIALAVSEANQCNYCLAAHSAIGKKAGLSDDEISLARQGKGKGSKETTILKFAKSIAQKRGHVSSMEIDELKHAGITDKELVEIILLVVSSVFTNYFNLVVEPQIDFPQVAKPVAV